MRLSITLIAAIPTAVVIAAPTSEIEREQQGASSIDANLNSPNSLAIAASSLERRRLNDFCYGAVIKNFSTYGGSPWANDCRSIANIIKNDGEWRINIGATRMLADHGSCTFRVKSPGSYILKVGNKDIIDIINTAVAYEQDGKIECSGTFACPEANTPTRMDMEWFLGGR